MGNRFCGNCGTEFNANGVCPKCGAMRPNESFEDAPTIKSDSPVTEPIDENLTMPMDKYMSDNSFNEFSGSGYNSYGDYSSGGSYGAYSSGSYGDYSSGTYGSGDYSGGGGFNQNGPAGQAEAKRSKTLPIILIICCAVLVLVAAIVILQVTGVIDLSSNSGNTGTAQDSVSRTVAVDEVSAGVQMSLTGTIVTEDYNGNKIYVLKLDSEREFQPTGKDAETYGSSLRATKVQIVSDLAAGYVNHSVRVDGTQRYRSESGHRYDVIIEDVTIEDFGEAGNTATDNTAANTQAQQESPAPAAQPSGTLLSASMTASTYQPNSGNRYYTPSMASDGNPQTCWMAYNESQHGAGTWICMSFGSTQSVSGIKFLNGNNWDTDADVYHLNGRICNYTITYDGGTIMSGTAPDNRGEYTYVTFPTAVNASYITLYVDSTYWGTKYNTVVCLSELYAIS